MKKEGLSVTLLVILSMLAGVGIMRTLDVIFGGYKPVSCRLVHLQKINEQLEGLKKNYFDGDVKNGE